MRKNEGLNFLSEETFNNHDIFSFIWTDFRVKNYVWFDPKIFYFIWYNHNFDNVISSFSVSYFYTELISFFPRNKQSIKGERNNKYKIVIQQRRYIFANKQ